MDDFDLDLDDYTQRFDDWFAKRGQDACPHGNPAGECDACDQLADFEYDAWRESK